MRKLYKKNQQPCATPYRFAEATAILGDCSDHSRDFGRGCANSWRTLCNNSESDPSNPRESPSLPHNGKALHRAAEFFLYEIFFCIVFAFHTPRL